MEAPDFTDKMKELTKSLKPYALKLTKDSNAADDLLQETFFKAYSNLSKFQEGTNFKAWMYTIMKNTFITDYQRMVRRNTFIDVTDNNHFINTSSYATENDALGCLIHNDIILAIDMMKDLYKVPFVLYFKGFKYYEIAKQLEIPIGTVKNRIHIARKELKKTLKMYEV